MPLNNRSFACQIAYAADVVKKSIRWRSRETTLYLAAQLDLEAVALALSVWGRRDAVVPADLPAWESRGQAGMVQAIPAGAVWDRVSAETLLYSEVLR